MRNLIHKFFIQVGHLPGIITPLQRDTILKLKYKSSLEEEMQIHGVEIYEAVIDNGIEDFEELKDWVKKRRLQTPYFWTP